MGTSGNFSYFINYLLTKDSRSWQWYEKAHSYAWVHFPDATNGEWFGYLNRQGDTLLTIKGGKWKVFLRSQISAGALTLLICC